MQFFIKVVISAFVIAGVSELGKRFSLLAAILASLPLTSILAMIWIYRDTRDVTKVTALSQGIFWAVLPSLIFFAVFPLLIKAGFSFTWAMVSASVTMALSYALYVLLLNRAGVTL